MELSAKQISEIIDGRIEGNCGIKVSSFSKIEEAKEGQISFLSNPKYENFIYSTKASIVIVNESLVLKSKVYATLIRVKDSYSAFALLLDHYINIGRKKYKGIHKRAVIYSKAKIGHNVYLGPNTVVEDYVRIEDDTVIMGNCFIAEGSVIGKNSLIYHGVNICCNTVIGNNVTIHSGAVIGSDGFGFAPVDGNYRKIPQIGNVVIGNDVEIGANTCIDRATMGSTVIGNGVKLDNLIQIAHNVQIGDNTVIAGHAAIAGSVKIGKNVMIGGKAGISGHLSVGDNAKLGPMSAIVRNVKAGESVMGAPAFNANKFFRSHIRFMNLDQIVKRIDEIEKKIHHLD